MPLYEYECTQCHERTERRQKFSDPEITVCPHCSGHLERVLSAPAISFKGGGWYSDLYSSPKPKSPDPKSPDNAKAATGGSDGGSTAAAPATAPAAPAAPAASSTAPASSSK